MCEWPAAFCFHIGSSVLSFSCRFCFFLSLYAGFFIMLTFPDFSQLFQGKTAYEVMQGVVQGYVNMNHQEKLLTFYKVIYSERSIQPMAARIVAEETERMIIATKQLFYAMVIHKLLHFENADMSAVSFAMASRQGRMKKVLYARQRLMFV